MRPSQIRNALNVCLDKNRPAFVWGPPGVGKSDIVAQVAKDRECELRDVRLNLLDPTDIKGFPVPNTAAGHMEWLPANFLPPMMIDKQITTGKGKAAKITTERVPNDTKGILFLDELNQAPPMVQAAAYQLLLNRKVGDYTLPEGWGILAAGNRESDRANAQRMPSALSLRLIHLDYDINVDDWCQWALDQGDRVPAELLAFIRFKPDLLHMFDPTQRSSPNPRGWVFCGELTNTGLPPMEEFDIFKGTVGEAAAIEYKGFLAMYRDLPSVDAIMLNPDTVPIPTGPSVMFAITAALAAATTKDLFGRFMQYVKRMDPEWQVTYVKDALARTKREIETTKEFTQFAIKNSQFLC